MSKASMTAGTALLVTLASGVTFLLATPATAEGMCPKGWHEVVKEEMMMNSDTDQYELATITECAKDERPSNISVRTSVTVDTHLLDNNLQKTGSGLVPADRFEYLGEKFPGPDGKMYIAIKQITTGKGGWGEKYQGWIPVENTIDPDMF
jgi:hypothetical protein